MTEVVLIVGAFFAGALADSMFNSYLQRGLLASLRELLRASQHQSENYRKVTVDCAAAMRQCAEVIGVLRDELKATNDANEALEALKKRRLNG